MKPDHDKAAELIAEGASIERALKDAGYSQATARAGRRAISKPVRDKLVKLLGKDWQARVSLGRQIKPEDMRDAVLGGLALNVSERTDAGVQSLKLAGSLKELNMFTQDSVAGVIVIEVPRLAEKPIPTLDAEIVPQLPEGKKD